MRKIYFYENNGECPVEEFFIKANEKIQKKFKFEIDYIRNESNPLTKPHVKHFAIEKYRELYEMRIKAADTMVRIVFYKQDEAIILLRAFYKRDRKDTEKALEASLKLLKIIAQNSNEAQISYKELMS